MVFCQADKFDLVTNNRIIDNLANLKQLEICHLERYLPSSDLP
jgi:hypothetical protein